MNDLVAPDAGTTPLQSRHKVYVAGHRGMVGSAIVRKLRQAGIDNIVTRVHAELDLCNQQAVQAFFADERPDHVILAAAKVGGIHANNTYSADFIYQNLMMECNVIDAAYRQGVERLLFLGSSCIYPREAPQPMSEDQLLSGPLEPTNEPYAVAKIAGIKLCESYNRQYGCHYRSLMPTNLYGPNDNFHLLGSHVVPAMIRKFHEAKQAGAATTTVWGTGTPRREFLHVDDMADAALFVMRLDDTAYAAATEPMVSHLNVGMGSDVSIQELAEMVRDVVGFNGDIVFDSDKPDGAPRKLLNVDKLKGLGWQARIGLRDGLAASYRWYLEHQGTFRS